MQCDSAVFNDVLDKRHVGNSEVTEASQNVYHSGSTYSAHKAQLNCLP